MKEKDFLLLHNLKGFKHTANEVIEKIRKDDFEKGVYRMNIHFYTHLNKRFDPLRKAGMLSHVGYKRGPSNRDEKIWALTQKAESQISTFANEIEINDNAA